MVYRSRSPRSGLITLLTPPRIRARSALAFISWNAQRVGAGLGELVATISEKTDCDAVGIQELCTAESPAAALAWEAQLGGQSLFVTP